MPISSVARDDMSSYRELSPTSAARTGRKSPLSLGSMKPIRRSEATLATTLARNARSESTLPGEAFGCFWSPLLMVIPYLTGPYSNGCISRENARRGSISIVGLASIELLELFGQRLMS